MVGTPALPYLVSRLPGHEVAKVKMLARSASARHRNIVYARRYLLVLRECADSGPSAGNGLMVKLHSTVWRSALPVVRRGGPLRATPAELLRVQRHKVPDAHRRPA